MELIYSFVSGALDFVQGQGAQSFVCYCYFFMCYSYDFEINIFIYCVIKVESNDVLCDFFIKQLCILQFIIIKKMLRYFKYIFVLIGMRSSNMKEGWGLKNSFFFINILLICFVNSTCFVVIKWLELQRMKEFVYIKWL